MLYPLQYTYQVWLTIQTIISIFVQEITKLFDTSRHLQDFVKISIAIAFESRNKLADSCFSRRKNLESLPRISILDILWNFWLHYDIPTIQKHIKHHCLTVEMCQENGTQYFLKDYLVIDLKYDHVG